MTYYHHMDQDLTERQRTLAARILTLRTERRYSDAAARRYRLACWALDRVHGVDGWAVGSL